jgi:protein-disulfide isomerase
MQISKTVQYPHRRKRRESRRLVDRPKLVFGASLGLAAIVAIGLVAASLLGLRGTTAKPAAVPPASASQFRGIPQHGVVLGAPAAPVTLVEYADLQCPFCGAWAREELPTVVDRLVRTGRLRVQFHGLAFVGTDSRTALGAALAAARQNRLWDFIDRLYAIQGPENSGWVEGALDDAASAAGLDRPRWHGDRQSNSVLGEIGNLGAQASMAGVTSTPSFAIARTGSSAKLLETHTLDAASLSALVDRLAPR